MPQTVGALVLVYVRERANLGTFAASTARNTRATLYAFAASMGSDRPPTYLTERRITAYLATRGHLAPSSRRAEQSRIHQFVRWLVRRKHLRSDPMADLDTPSVPRYTPRAMKRADVDVIVRYAQTTDARLYLIVCLMVQEGLRCVEVSRLQTGDVDLDAGTMVVVGKGGHQRLLPLSDQTSEALRAVLAGRRAAGPVVTSTSHPGTPLVPATISAQVGRAMRRLDVVGSAHRLRHTMATELVDRGCDIRQVRDALGHVSIATTDRYIGRTSQSQLRSAMSGRRYGLSA